MLYLHIPFCKQACSYCNFHFSTSVRGRSELLLAMQNEIRLRAKDIQQAGTDTIYFGGGTPSLLDLKELDGLLDAIEAALNIDYRSVNPLINLDRGTKLKNTAKQREVTLEANPDDLTVEKVAMLRDSAVNRLSIGLQSFQEADLRYMNRAHTAKESSGAMQRVIAAGFDNLTVDLIYGSPTTSDADWDDNISRVLDFGVNHISAYALTVEPKTALAHKIKTHQLKGPEDERFARHFDRLVERLTMAGFEHYEISNFARPGYYSKHNTGYWQGKPYVGIGPSAHGFNGHDQRQWNLANNALYTRLLTKANELPEGLNEIETLSKADQYNEYVMTGLRTMWGVKLDKVLEKFGAVFATHFHESVNTSNLHCYFVSQKTDQGHYILNQAGKRMADGIAGELFWLTTK